MTLLGEGNRQRMFLASLNSKNVFLDNLQGRGQLVAVIVKNMPQKIFRRGALPFSCAGAGVDSVWDRACLRKADGSVAVKGVFDLVGIY